MVFMLLGISLLICLIFPISDIFDFATYENNEITHGCKVSYLVKSTCYDKFSTFEYVKIRYPFSFEDEYQFREGGLTQYSHHRFGLFYHIDDTDMLNKRFPEAKNNILLKTKELFKR